MDTAPGPCSCILAIPQSWWVWGADATILETHCHLVAILAAIQK